MPGFSLGKYRVNEEGVKEAPILIHTESGRSEVKRLLKTYHPEFDLSHVDNMKITPFKVLD